MLRAASQSRARCYNNIGNPKSFSGRLEREDARP